MLFVLRFMLCVPETLDPEWDLEVLEIAIVSIWVIFGRFVEIVHVSHLQGNKRWCQLISAVLSCCWILQKMPVTYPRNLILVSSSIS